jgi:hypothetical protein
MRKIRMQDLLTVRQAAVKRLGDYLIRSRVLTSPNWRGLFTRPRR